MKTKRKKINLKIIVILTACCMIISSLYICIKLTSRVNATKDIIFQIDNNSSIKQIVNKLNSIDELKPAWFFEIVTKSYAYMTNKHIFAGMYKFNSNLTNAELVVALFNEDNLIVRRVTFPEGITLKKFASILQQKLNIDSVAFIQKCYDKEFIRTLKLNTDNLEGYLMPATFNFFIDVKIESIIKILVEEQKKIWLKYKNQAEKIGFDCHKTLTLASIIEAETPVISERRTISAVYHNRLKKNMLLQADPTVQYALGVTKKRLLYSDLAVNSRYNTYKYPGLPPGPINSPSALSIAAAVNPENNNFLFFVAVGDGSNRHNFSKSFAEHKKQVSKFRKNKKTTP